MSEQSIRDQVLRALALNRVPGYHFCGNFFDTMFARVASDDSQLLLQPGAHCSDADGQLNIGAFAVFADVALATSVRAGLDRSVRLATVALNLQFSGAARRGPLEATSVFQSYFNDAAGRQGLSRVDIRSAEGLVCFGSGGFMVMPPPRDQTLHPHPMPRRAPDAPPVPLLEERELDANETRILRHAEQALADSGPHHTGFIDRFLGYRPHQTADGASCVLVNGPHIGNRVGHVQGGILLGLAAVTASTALGQDWALSGVTACYLSPGEGQELQATSTIIHQGRLTAVVRTQVTGTNRRRVLEVTSTHARRADISTRT